MLREKPRVGRVPGKSSLLGNIIFRGVQRKEEQTATVLLDLTRRRRRRRRRRKTT